MCRRIAMEGYCRLGKECAYNHKLLQKSSNDDTELLHENIKNMKAEIDALKDKVNNLIVTKKESKILKKDVEYIKEEINILRAANKETADKISKIENDFEYETEDESETCNAELQSSNSEQFNNNKENENCEYDEDLFQTEIVNQEVLFVCNICNEGFDTESEVKKHLTKKHEDILSNVSKGSQISFNNKKEEIKEAHIADKGENLLEEAEANSVLGNAKDNELETSQRALESKPSLDDSNTSENIKEIIDEEESLDEYDYYEGFDEDGNKIIDHPCWS